MSVIFTAKPQRPHTEWTTEGSVCSKWPPAELKWPDRHQPLSAHLSAQRTERENTKGRFNWTQGAKKTRRDGMAGQKKKAEEKGSCVL